jgi:hypothetical protein
MRKTARIYPEEFFETTQGNPAHRHSRRFSGRRCVMTLQKFVVDIRVQYCIGLLGNRWTEVEIFLEGESEEFHSDHEREHDLMDGMVFRYLRKHHPQIFEESDTYKVPVSARFLWVVFEAWKPLDRRALG